MELSKATCATCPCWVKEGNNPSGFGSFGSCELNPPTEGDGLITYSNTSCSYHPIRRAAYELAVQAAKEAKPNG